MAQDLRSLFKKERATKKFPLKDGHEARFLQKLEEALPVEKPSTSSFYWLKIAASIVLVLGTAAFYFLTQDGGSAQVPSVVSTTQNASKETTISLGDLSPDLKKIENYYVANINYELAQLTISSSNKDMVDGFMEQLAELDAEYNTLTQELNEFGPNDETVSALIQNLQLRLQLLQKLKQKLNQLKSSKNEQDTHII